MQLIWSVNMTQPDSQCSLDIAFLRSLSSWLKRKSLNYNGISFLWLLPLCLTDKHMLFYFLSFLGHKRVKHVKPGDKAKSLLEFRLILNFQTEDYIFHLPLSFFFSFPFGIVCNYVSRKQKLMNNKILFQSKEKFPHKIQEMRKKIIQQYINFKCVLQRKHNQQHKQNNWLI